LSFNAGDQSLVPVLVLENQTLRRVVFSCIVGRVAIFVALLKSKGREEIWEAKYLDTGHLERRIEGSDMHLC
jgi:hypothetical protein